MGDDGKRVAEEAEENFFVALPREAELVVLKDDVLVFAEHYDYDAEEAVEHLGADDR